MKSIITGFLLILTIPVFAWQKDRDTSRELIYTPDQLNKILVPVQQWKPIPDLSDLQNRQLIPQAIRDGYIKEGEHLLSVDWKSIPVTTFLEFSRNGNRNHYEDLSFQRRNNLASLVLAEAFERKGRFIDQVINGIWAVCEESYWGSAAHLFLQKEGPGLPDVKEPTVDLFVSETGAELAWIYYLLKPEMDKINPLIADRIKTEIHRRILKPYLESYDWTYLGYKWRASPASMRRVNNWNPWVNSNVLAAALILSDEEIRTAIVYKTITSINNFILPYPEDGGSDEGPQYWGRAAGSFFDYIELLKSATGGKINYSYRPLFKRMGHYICQMYIKNDYYVNYGDADAEIFPDPALLYRFGKESGDDTLCHFAAFIARRTGFGKSTLKGSFGVLNRVLPALFVAKELLTIKAEEPLPADVWLPATEVMASRSKPGTAEGLYLVAKGGNNDASHNHNDIGNFCIYADGRPVLVDAGAQTYTKETFGNDRYTIWNNQSGYHNVPSINGAGQKEGATFRASGLRYFKNEGQASLSMDIAQAYPAEAQVSSWLRKTTLNRGKNIIIREKYLLHKYIKPFTENFITPLLPDIKEKGVVVLTDSTSGRQYHILYDRNRFYSEIDTIAISDGQTEEQSGKLINEKGRMQNIWGDVLYRVRLISRKKRLSDTFNIVIGPVKRSSS